LKGWDNQTPKPSSYLKFSNGFQSETQYLIGFHCQVGQVGWSRKLSVLALKIFFCDPTGHAAWHSKIKVDPIFDHCVEELAQGWKANTLNGINHPFLK
jgi:hypothetical protein